MPRTIACPNCRKPFEVADADLGRTLTCPSCQAAVPTPPQMSLDAAPISTEPRRPPASEQIAPAARASRPAYQGDYEERELDISQGDSGRGWGTTVVGLRMLYGSVLIYVIVTLLFQVVTIAAAPTVAAGAAAPPHEAGLFGVAAMLSGCVMIVVGITGFVGMCMCCTAPDRAAARRSIFSIVLLVGFVIVLIAVIVMLLMDLFAAIAKAGPGNQPDPQEFWNHLGPAGKAGLVVAAGLFVAGWVFRLLSHLSVADHFGDAHLRSQARGLMLLSVPLMIGSQVANLWLQRSKQTLTSIYAQQAIGIVITLCVFGWYAYVCQLTYRVIETSTQARPRRSDYDA
jgi:hypothetical protein